MARHFFDAGPASRVSERAALPGRISMFLAEAAPENRADRITNSEKLSESWRDREREKCTRPEKTRAKPSQLAKFFPPLPPLIFPRSSVFRRVPLVKSVERRKK